MGKVKVSDTREIVDSAWFTHQGATIGIIKIEDKYEGFKYYIGNAPGENENLDLMLIADWGAHFPKAVGDALFGGAKDD